jgi:hypothetical protein
MTQMKQIKTLDHSLPHSWMHPLSKLHEGIKNITNALWGEDILITEIQIMPFHLSGSAIINRCFRCWIIWIWDGACLTRTTVFRVQWIWFWPFQMPIHDACCQRKHHLLVHLGEIAKIIFQMLNLVDITKQIGFSIAHFLRMLGWYSLLNNLAACTNYRFW